jgi:hypothetical protein
MFRRFEDLSHGIVNMTGVSSACYDAMVEMAGMLRAALDLAVEKRDSPQIPSTA